MRVDILAIGSRGDVQLYVALGLRLRAVGYRVRIVTLGGFEELLRDRGLDHLVIGDSPQQIANTSEGRDWVQKRTSPAGFFQGFVRVANSLIEEGMARYWNHCSDVEALIVSPMGLLVGEHIAERLGVPVVRTQAAPPVMRTRYAWDGSKSWGSAVKGRVDPQIHRTFHFVVWSKLRRSTNAARSKVLNLPPLSLTAPFRRSNKIVPLLAAYSPAVAPPMPDWESWIHVTGYWFLDEARGWTPPNQLVDFLDSGSPPVFVGFGSTPFPNPEATADLVVRALARAGQRGILVAGESGLPTGTLSPDVLSVDSVPHGWLFARACAAVHHGGAGVTGAALRAGLPSVVVPVFADQPFWGKRVFQLGAGPAPIQAKALTEDKLTNAIRATASEHTRRRAAEIGAKISREDGVGRAVEIIDRHLGRSASKVMSHHAS